MTRNFLRVSILLSVLFCTFSCSPAPDGETITGSGSRSPNAPAFMKGTVTYEETGRPVEDGGVEVYLYEISDKGGGDYTWSEAAMTYADTDGVYLFDSVGTGEYTVVVKEDPYLAWDPVPLEGFGGYVTVNEDDTGITVDTVVLGPTYSVMGMFQNLYTEAVRVDIVGTGYGTVITDLVTNPFFGFSSLPAGDYRLKIIINYGTPRATKYYCPLPTELTDTTYTQVVYSHSIGVHIDGQTVELRTPYFILTCMVRPNATAYKTDSREAADLLTRQLLIDAVEARQIALPDAHR